MVDAINKHIIPAPDMASTLSVAGVAFYGLIYKATAPSGKAYIGKTTNYTRRRKDHEKGVSNCPALIAAITKYGDAMNWQVIGVAMTKDALNAAECFAISHYNTMSPKGYNMTAGGEGGKQSPEVLARMSMSVKKAFAERPELVAGVRRVHCGRKRSDITRAKMSASHKGKKHSPQHCANISAGRLAMLAK